MYFSAALWLASSLQQAQLLRASTHVCLEAEILKALDPESSSRSAECHWRAMKQPRRHMLHVLHEQYQGQETPCRQDWSSTNATQGFSVAEAW